MPNPYTRPAEYTPYVAPLDLAFKAALSMQDKFDDVSNKSGVLEDVIYKTNYIKEHEPFHQELVSKYNTSIESIYDSLERGETQKAKRDLFRLNRQFQADPTRAALERSVEQRKLHGQALKKSGAIEPWQDPTSGFTGVSDTGELEEFTFQGITDRLDWEKKASDMMTTKPDGSPRFIPRDDGTGKTLVFDTLTSEYITEDKVKTLAQNQAPQFLTNTEEGQQFSKRERYRNPDITNEELLSKAGDFLFSSGRGQIFSKSKVKRTHKYIPEHVLGKAKNPFDVSFSESDTQAAPFAMKLNLTNQMSFDSKGQLQTPSVPEGSREFSASEVIGGLAPAASKVKYVPSPELLKEQKTKVDAYRSKYNFGTAMPKEIMETIETSINNTVGRVSSKRLGRLMNNKVAKYLNLQEKELFNRAALTSSRVHLMDSQGVSTAGSLGDVLKELGYEDIDEIEEVLKEKTKLTGIAPFNPFVPGGFLATIPSKKDNSIRNIIVEPNDLQKGEFQLSYKVSEAMRKDITKLTSEPTSIPLGGDVQLLINPELDKENKRFKFSIYVTNKSGEVMKDNQTGRDMKFSDIEDLIEYEKNNFSQILQNIE